MRHDADLHADLIEQLGGYRAVAERCGRHETTVFRWTQTGIPPELWPAFAQLAKRHGIIVSADALALTSPRYRDRAKLKPKKAG